MKRINVVFKYILGLLLTISIFFVSLLSISKITILNKKYIFNSMDKLNYYDVSYKTIKENLIWSNMSSGLDDDILDDIFTIDDIKNDVKITIDSLYDGKKIIINTNKIKEKLVNNINNYIKINEIKVNDKKALDEHIEELIKVYTNEITYYSYFNNYTNIISKINKYINILLIISVILTIILVLLAIFVLKKNIISPALISAGLFMIFIYLHTIINIDYNTITIISNNFSILARYISNNLVNIYNISSYIFIGFGLFLGIIKKIKE